MHTVIGKQNLTATIRRIDIRTEALVAKLKPGHFVTVMLDPLSRPVPHNIFEVDWRRKCVSIIFEEKDELTHRMGELRINDHIHAVNGPFGAPVALEKKGTMIFVGEGLGIAALLNLARAFKQAGNKVIGIAGFETRKTSLFESQLRLNCNKAYVMYKDGMHERKGEVMGPLLKVLDDEPVVSIYADVSAGMLCAIRLAAAGKGTLVFVDLLRMLGQTGFFDENRSVILGGQRYFPAAQGTIVDAQSFDAKELDRAVSSQREYVECRKKELASLRQRSVFARLKKLFWA